MKSSLRNAPARTALKGLSLGASAILALSLVGCGGTASSENQEPAPTTQAQGQEGEQPNIMMVLLDDLGYTDLGAFGGEAETPNIDALAQESAQFTDFYATPLCAPTRASLLTGQDRHQVGLGSMEGLLPPGVPASTPGYKGSLEGDYTGIAEVLGEAGYDTYQVGKWHLGEDEGQTPTDLGFDNNFTLYDAGASYYPDAHRLFDRKSGDPVDTVIHERDGKTLDSLPDDFFSTRTYTDEMIQMVDQSVDSQQPFFGYLGYTAPHDPLHVENTDLIDHYLEMYRDGHNFEELREERIQRMVELGLLDGEVDTRWPEQAPTWDSLSPEEQEDTAYRMAVYSAVVQETDEHIGRLIDHLKETGEYDNTLFVLASDNGANPKDYTNYAQHHGTIKGWHEQTYPLVGEKESYGLEGSFPSLGQPNALAASGPYFEAKNTLFEGGIRVPALIKTPTSGGENEHRIVDTLAHITDLYPTFADYAGADLSTADNLLGDSARPLLEGTSESIGDDEFGWEHFGHRAYRAGDWKLIYVPEQGGGTGDYALYDLASDPGETRDISGENPEIVEELAAKWDQYAADNGVAVVEIEAVNEAAANR